MTDKRERRRAQVQILALVLNPLIIWLIYYFTGYLLYMQQNYEFNANSTLSLTISDCSLKIVQHDGDLGVLEERRNRETTSSTILYNFDSVNSDTILVEEFKVMGNLPCAKYFERDCDLVCEITLKVPQKNSLTLKITQADSKLGLSNIHFENVSIQNVRVVGSHISTTMKQTLTENTYIKTKRSVTIVDSKLTNGQIDASTIQIRYSNTSDIGIVDVRYRAVSYPDRVCIMGENIQHTPLNETLDECTANNVQYIMKDYDPDQNARITRDEITNALESSGKCCGSKCPKKSSCSLIGGQYISYTQAFVSAADFLQQLNNSYTGDYTMIPRCMRRAKIQGDGSIEEKLSLTSLDGSIQVLFAKGFEESTLLGENPSGALTKFPLLTISSYNEIKSLITDIYGNGPTDASDIYAIFYIRRRIFASHIGTTVLEKFVYSNHAFYLTISPSILSALTFGILAPKVIVLEPIFVADGCYAGPEVTEFPSNLGKILYDTLIPITRTSLWGNFVQISPGSDFIAAPLSQISVSTYGELEVRTFIHKSTTRIAYILSIAISILTSFMILSKFDVIMKTHLRLSAEKSRIHDDVEKSHKKKRGLSNKRVQNLSNVFEQPIELCNIMVVEPARRYFTNSLLNYIYAKYDLYSYKPSRWRNRDVVPNRPKVDSRTRDINDLTMSTFMTGYEVFCFDMKLDMETNPHVVRERLFKSFGILIRGWNTERIHGCLWKPLSACTTGLRFAPEYNFEDIQLSDDDKAKLMENELHMFQLFISNCLICTGNVEDFICLDDLSDRTLSKPLLPGGRDVFKRFSESVVDKYKLTCHSSILIPSNEEIKSNEEFQELGLQKTAVTIQTICDLKPIRNAQGTSTSTFFSWRWYAILFVETTLHQSVFVFGPFIILNFVLTIETMKSETNFIPENQKYGLTTVDILNLPWQKNLSDIQLSQIVRIALVLCAVAVSVCYFDLFLVYLRVQKGNRIFNRIMRLGYRFVFSLTLLLMFFIMCWQCIWIIVCAFVKPDMYLPFGTAVSTFFTIIADEYRKIAKVKTKLVQYTDQLYKQKIAGRFKDALLLISRVEESPELEKLKLLVSGDLKTIDPDTLFDFINYKTQSPEIESLNRDEFETLFEVLRINVLPYRRDAMFQYCDSGETDGKVTRLEFQSAWNWLMRELSADMVSQGFGMSNFEITLYLCLVSVNMIALLSFLLLTLPDLSSNSNFNSIIQSTILAGGSKLATDTLTSFGGLSATMELASGDELKQVVETKVDAETDASS